MREYRERKYREEARKKAERKRKRRRGRRGDVLFGVLVNGWVVVWEGDLFLRGFEVFFVWPVAFAYLVYLMVSKMREVGSCYER